MLLPQWWMTSSSHSRPQSSGGRLILAIKRSPGMSPASSSTDRRSTGPNLTISIWTPLRQKRLLLTTSKRAERSSWILEKTTSYTGTNLIRSHYQMILMRSATRWLIPSTRTMRFLRPTGSLRSMLSRIPKSRFKDIVMRLTLRISLSTAPLLKTGFSGLSQAISLLSSRALAVSISWRTRDTCRFNSRAICQTRKTETALSSSNLLISNQWRSAILTPECISIRNWKIRLPATSKVILQETYPARVRTPWCHKVRLELPRLSSRYRMMEVRLVRN